jgi:hypothetical protein
VTVNIGPREDIVSRNLRIQALGDVSGKLVLDVGGNEGAVAAYALEIGATRAIVVDVNLPNPSAYGPGWSVGEYPYHGVEYVTSNFYDYHEPAEIVIAGNIFYHVTNPLKLAWHLRKLTRERLVMWTAIHLDGDGHEWRENEYIAGPGDEGPTVWDCSENACLDLLRAVGFNPVRIGRNEHNFFLTATPEQACVV